MIKLLRRPRPHSSPMADREFYCVGVVSPNMFLSLQVTTDAAGYLLLSAVSFSLVDNHNDLNNNLFNIPTSLAQANVMGTFRRDKTNNYGVEIESCESNFRNDSETRKVILTTAVRHLPKPLSS